MSGSIASEVEAIIARHPEAKTDTALLMRLAALAQSQSDQAQWRDATKELPDADTTVLIAIPEAECEPVWVGYHDGTVWRDIQDVAVKVTHWMHLPTPPTA